MANINEIKENDLEKVSGGLYLYRSVEDMVFLYTIGTRIEMHTGVMFKQRTKGMIVKKLGYYYEASWNCYEPCYYMEAIKESEHDHDGWYDQYTMDVKHDNGSWPRLDDERSALMVVIQSN